MTGQADVGAALDEVVEELTRLEAAATPGPWRTTEATGGSQAERRALGTFSLLHNGEREVALVRGFTSDRDPDAELIAAVRNHLPALLAALRGTP